MKFRKNTILILVVLAGLSITQFANPPKVYAANFSVNSAATLIAAINTANTNNADDVITLTANITLTAVDNGVNGLPVILSFPILHFGHLYISSFFCFGLDDAMLIIN